MGSENGETSCQEVLDLARQDLFKDEGIRQFYQGGPR